MQKLFPKVCNKMEVIFNFLLVVEVVLHSYAMKAMKVMKKGLM